MTEYEVVIQKISEIRDDLKSNNPDYAWFDAQVPVLMSRILKSGDQNTFAALSDLVNSFMAMADTVAATLYVAGLRDAIVAGASDTIR